MPSTERGTKACSSQHSPCSPGASTPGMEAFLQAWQLSLCRGSGPSSHPRASFLSSSSYLPRMSASSPLSLWPSLEWQNTDAVQKRGWVGPGQCLLQAHLPWGWSYRDTQSKKPAAGGHAAGTKKRFVQKASPGMSAVPVQTEG